MSEVRKRDISLRFRVSSTEHDLLKERMAKAGTNNLEAFLRKMALDGMIVRLDVPEIKEMISLLRYSGNNINQLTKQLHAGGRVYDTDLDDISKNQEKLIELANTIIQKLASLR